MENKRLVNMEKELHNPDLYIKEGDVYWTDFNITKFLEGEEIVTRRATQLEKRAKTFEDFKELAIEYELIHRFTRNAMNHIFARLGYPDAQK